MIDRIETLGPQHFPLPPAWYYSPSSQKLRWGFLLSFFTLLTKKENQGMKIKSLLLPLAGIVLSFHSRLVESFVPCNDAFSRAQSIYAASLVGKHDLSNSSDQSPSDKIGLIAKISDTLKPKATKERKKLCLPEEVVSINEYKEKVVDEKEQMVVVRFYAPWCRACKAAQAPYRKLSRDFSNERIKFIECPVTGT